MLTHDDIQRVLQDIQFNDWAFDLRLELGSPLPSGPFRRRLQHHGEVTGVGGEEVVSLLR